MDKENSEVKFHDVLARGLDGLNITQTAKDIGISPSLLFDWVKGRRSPRLDSAPALMKLADYLGLSFTELIFDNKEKEGNKTITSVKFSDRGAEYLVQIRRVK